MHILFAAATAAEFPEEFGAGGKPSGESWLLPDQPPGNCRIEAVLTGVGQASACLVLGELLSRKPFDLAVNTGVAGSFREYLRPGDTVIVERDCFADLGAEDDHRFLPLPELGLEPAFPGLFREGWLVPPIPRLECIKGMSTCSAITVNTAHGRVSSIQETVRHFEPDIESMEGAAFFLACMRHSVPSLQVRAISNRVERRDRLAWKLEEAVASLNKISRSLLHEFGTFGLSAQ